MPKKIDINELISLLKNHDNRGFSILYDNYSTALYGIICKIVKDEEEAENLLQDAFVKIWKRIDDYDSSKGTLFTWILNIARNTAIDFLRSKEFSQQSKNQSIADFVGIELSNNDHHETEYIGLRELVEKLDPNYRQVIDLVYFLGYTQEEAAEYLKIPLGTVKTRTRIAIRELRKWVV